MSLLIHRDNVPVLAGNVLIYRWNSYIIEYNVVSEELILNNLALKYNAIYKSGQLLINYQEITVNIKDNMVYFMIPKLFVSVGLNIQQLYHKVYDNYILHIENGKCIITYINAQTQQETEFLYYDANITNTIIAQDIFRIFFVLQKNTHDNIVRIVQDDYIYKCWVLNYLAIVTYFNILNDNVYNIIYKYDKNIYTINYQNSDILVNIKLKRDILHVKISFYNHDKTKLNMYRSSKQMSLIKNRENIYVNSKQVNSIVSFIDIVDASNKIINNVDYYYNNLK